MDDFPPTHHDLPPEHRPGAREGMKLAPLSAGVDLRGQPGEEDFIEVAAREFLGKTRGVDADEDRAKSTGDHLHGEIPRVPPPEWKDARQPGSLEKPLSIGANVFEKEVSEHDVRDPLLGSAGELGEKRLLVDLVRAGMRNRNHAERKLQLRRLPAKELFADSVDRNPAIRRGDGRQQTGQLESSRETNGMERPGGVLPAAPGDESAGKGHDTGGRRSQPLPSWPNPNAPG